MEAPRELLELCRMLVYQEMMLDVAATIAATQAETAPAMKPAAARLALLWFADEAARDTEMARAS